MAALIITTWTKWPEVTSASTKTMQAPWTYEVDRSRRGVECVTSDLDITSGSASLVVWQMNSTHASRSRTVTMRLYTHQPTTLHDSFWSHIWHTDTFQFDHSIETIQFFNSRNSHSKGLKVFQHMASMMISDRTDLSTESGSGPIQLARDRYRATRRSVADSPPHCMNAQKIVSYYTQSHTCRKQSGETEHSVHGAEAESPSISTCHVAAHASGLGERDHKRHRRPAQATHCVGG